MRKEKKKKEWSGTCVFKEKRKNCGKPVFSRQKRKNGAKLVFSRPHEEKNIKEGNKQPVANREETRKKHKTIDHCIHRCVPLSNQRRLIII